MAYFSYVLKSIHTGRKYYGSCHDLQKRLDLHNRKKVRSTRPYAPYTIIYFEQFESRREAIKRENFYKSINGYIFLKQAGKI